MGEEIANEGHAYNIVHPKGEDNKERPYLLDSANPALIETEPGTMQWKMYLAPLNQEQLENLTKGQEILVNYAGDKRSYMTI